MRVKARQELQDVIKDYCAENNLQLIYENRDAKAKSEYVKIDLMPAKPQFSTLCGGEKGGGVFQIIYCGEVNKGSVVVDERVKDICNTYKAADFQSIFLTAPPYGAGALPINGRYCVPITIYYAFYK